MSLSRRAGRRAGTCDAPLQPRERLPEPADRIPAETSTLTEALTWHARTHPDRVHLRVLGDDGTVQELTYGGLRREAAGVAAGLLARGLRPGETVAIMLPTGREYFTVFTGILLAGGVPVPIYPPGRPDRLAEHLRRQARILDNARACALITTPEAGVPARLLRGRVESVRHVLDPAELGGYGEIVGVPRRAADLAMLQYTSGSTGDPKGVMLSHANLLADIRAMGEAARVTAADAFVSWLPLYHDMGLIGAWLSSLYFGMPVAVMAPTTFLARPARWLWAVHEQRGTLTAGPNFAFELCLRKIDDAELEGLDLSCVRMLFNGAEPVHASTLEEFAARFARFGLRREALAPVYGLAEACVGLTFPPPGRGPLIDRVARAEFTDRGRAVPAAPDDPDVLRFVGCGRALPGHLVRVVDVTGVELGARREGRIEFRGPAATGGYFRNRGATDELLRGGWLDTGDLGYLDNGELYVTGRIKDLVIRAGHNLHPEELEHVIGAIAGIRKGCVAVFAARDPGGGSERLVVLAETRRSDAPALAELRHRVVATTVDLLGTPPDEVVLAPPGTVPKTSSGKIRRATARASYERGVLRPARRPMWWQLARFAAPSAGPQLRRVARAIAVAVFTARFWASVAAVGLPTLVTVAVLPTVGARAATARSGRADLAAAQRHRPRRGRCRRSRAAARVRRGRQPRQLSRRRHAVRSLAVALHIRGRRELRPQARARVPAATHRHTARRADRLGTGTDRHAAPHRGGPTGRAARAVPRGRALPATRSAAVPPGQLPDRREIRAADRPGRDRRDTHDHAGRTPPDRPPRRRAPRRRGTDRSDRNRMGRRRRRRARCPGRHRGAMRRTRSGPLSEACWPNRQR